MPESSPVAVQRLACRGHFSSVLAPGVIMGSAWCLEAAAGRFPVFVWGVPPPSAGPVALGVIGSSKRMPLLAANAGAGVWASGSRRTGRGAWGSWWGAGGRRNGTEQRGDLDRPG